MNQRSTINVALKLSFGFVVSVLFLQLGKGNQLKIETKEIMVFFFVFNMMVNSFLLIGSSMCYNVCLGIFRKCTVYRYSIVHLCSACPFSLFCPLKTLQEWKIPVDLPEIH